MRTLTCLSLAVSTLLSAAPLDDAARLLQNQRFKEAAEALTDSAVQGGGYARYLRAVGCSAAGQYALALADCDAIGESDVWHRKARFLKAECLAELKRHAEAEAIYSAEAARLFATVRKEKLAAALVELAEELRKPALPGQSASGEALQKALTLYQKALEIETGPQVRENLRFQSADITRVLLKTPQMITACEDYLAEFDPDWRKPSKAVSEGSRRWKVRQMLIETLLYGGDTALARRYAEEVLAVWKKSPPSADTQPDEGEIEWLICRSHARGASEFDPPQVPQGQYYIETDHPALTASLRVFLKKHASHARAAEAAHLLLRSLSLQKKTEEAIAACQALYDRADWSAPAADANDKRTPAERLMAWRQEAFFKIGELRFAALDFVKAIEQWRQYIAKHPDGSLWQQAQARILDAEFQLCLDAVTPQQREEMTRRFEAFIAAHPLDERCAQLLFINGQWHYAAALQAVKDKADAKPAFESAISEWAKLITKHPQSEEASLALYRTGVILAEHLERHEEALAAFERLKWGSWSDLAKERAAMMPQRSLALRSPRVFRSTEAAQVIASTRNIEKLKVSRYTLNLEDYFRSRHRLDGAAGIGSLDIDLIQPDKTWEVPVAGFARLKPIEQAIDVPFEGAQPGVCLIRVEGEDWQASTIVIRSDVDVILQSAWREGLVFVLDRVKNAPVGSAEVLISDGKEIIGQGVTGADGVFRLRSEKVRAAADLCVFVRSASGMAISRLNLRGMTQEITGGSTDRESLALSARGFIYTDRPAYRAGEVLHFRGLFREVKDGAYSVPEGVEHEIVIRDDEKRVLRRLRSKLSAHGSYTHSVPLPENMPVGRYSIVSTPTGSEQRFEAQFEVSEFELAEISAVIETKPEAVFRGDVLEAVLRVNYSWGSPLADEPVRVHLPDGRLLEGKTDAEGRFAFQHDTAGVEPGSFLSLQAELPARKRTVQHAVPVLRTGLSLKWDRVPAPALAGEAALIRVQALDHRGKPTTAEVKLTLSKLPAQPANAVLEGVPGLRYAPAAEAPVKLSEFTLKTEAAGGLAETRPVVADAGRYELIASSTDARGNAVELRGSFEASGADDATKLRLFSETDEIAEGKDLLFDAHTRVEAPLALMTFAGEDIVEYRVLALKGGHNELKAAVKAAHWPHFAVSVTFLDGDKLHEARRGFRVTRPLKIEIETPKTPPQPGAEKEIVLTARDSNGQPVANAELSLALASTALFDQFSDSAESIEEHFYGDLRRATSLRVNSNAGFHHTAASKVVKQDETGASLAEAAETPSHRELEQRMQEREKQVWYQSQEDGRQHQRLRLVEGFLVPSQFDPPQLAQGFVGGGTLTLNSLAATSTVSGLRSGGSLIQNGALFFGDAAGVNGLKPFAHDAQWHCPLVTDADGKAHAMVRMPKSSGEWRLNAVGSTVSTQVGDAVKEMVTRSPFAAELRMPAALHHADSFKPQVKIHGAPAGADAQVNASFYFSQNDEKQLHQQTLQAVTAANKTVQVPFEAVKASRTLGWHSANANAEQGSFKYLTVDGQIFHNLPAGELAVKKMALIFDQPKELPIQADKAEWMELAIFSTPRTLLNVMSAKRMIERPTTPQTAASVLLSCAASGLADRTVEALAAAQITQREGGWSWQDVDWLPDSVVTSLGLWGMVEAKALGVEVEEKSIKSATECLKRMLAVIPPEEPDKAAVILHALACVNEADFSVVNRLFRDRAKLNDPAAAWLAAALLRMNRTAEADELLRALEAKKEWMGSETTARLSSVDDTAAIVLYASARRSAGSALAKRAADILMNRLGPELGAESALQGLWTAALAEYFKGEGLLKLDADPQMTLSITGEKTEVLAGYRMATRVPKADAKGQIRLSLKWNDGKAMPIVLVNLISEVPVDEKAASQADLPTVTKREWLHEGLRHKDVPLKVSSTSPVKVAAQGQRIRVHVELKKPVKAQRGYVIVDEPLPGGAMLVPGSVSGGADRVEVLPGLLRLWFIPGRFDEDKGLGYELMALHAGTFAIPHTRVRDACRPGRFNAGPAGALTILEPGKASTDVYVMNRWERLELAELLFKENALEEARQHLEVLRTDAEMMKGHEREIAQMLLSIHTGRVPMDARQVVELFEALSERHADVVIPFDQILQVAAAYRQIGEHERAWLVHRATLESGFVRDAGVSAALESAGDFINGAAHLTGLWMEHPDGEDGKLAVFSLGQRFQEMAGNPAAVPLRPGGAKWSEKQLLERSRDLLREFATLHAKDALADDAAFSLANVFFALKDYAAVVDTAGSAARTHAKGPFVNQFHYMTALGRFWQYQFPEALNAAAPVATGSSEDAPNARYITAQIHHAQGNAAEALRWYEKVKEDFEDAAESIRVLEEKGVKLPHATRVRPGEAVKVELEHRNVQEAALTIYRVDLMKLHERQKDLTKTGAVNLSGITPQAELKVPLGDGKDYAWKKRALELPLKDEGAYLIICRGDSQMTSGLVLISTLELETHEDRENGSLRAQVRDTARGSYLADAEMAVYDSTGAATPQKGRSDPRGAFSASGIRGHATLVVKHGESRYAIHRSATPLMTVEMVKRELLPPVQTPVTESLAAPVQQASIAMPTRNGAKPMSKDDYLKNVQGKFLDLNSSNNAEWQMKLQKGGKGVKAEKAFKK